MDYNNTNGGKPDYTAFLNSTDRVNVLRGSGKGLETLAVIGAVAGVASNASADWITCDGSPEALAEYGITKTGTDSYTSVGNGITWNIDSINDLTDEIVINGRASNTGSGVFAETTIDQIFGNLNNQISQATGLSNSELSDYVTLTVSQEGVNLNGRYTAGSTMDSDGNITLNGTGLGVIPFDGGQYVDFSVAYQKNLGDGRYINSIAANPKNIFTDSVVGTSEDGFSSWKANSVGFDTQAVPEPMVSWLLGGAGIGLLLLKRFGFLNRSRR